MMWETSQEIKELIQTSTSVGLSAMSVACDIVMMINYYAVSESNDDVYDYFFVIAIAINDGIRNIAKLCWLLIGNDVIACSVQAFFINYGGISVFWWMGTISIIVCAGLSGCSKRIIDAITQKRTRIFMLINIIGPFFFSMLPFMTLSYGKAGSAWCWISDDNNGTVPFFYIHNHNSTSISASLYWHTVFGIISYYGHLITSYILCIISIIVGRKYKDNPLFSRLKRYPFCLLPWIFPLIRRSYEWITLTKAPYVLTLVHTFVSGSMGIFIIFCYGRIKIHKEIYKKFNLKILNRTCTNDVNESNQVQTSQSHHVELDQLISRNDTITGETGQSSGQTKIISSSSDNVYPHKNSLEHEMDWNNTSSNSIQNVI
eukprot:506796_1